MRRLDKLDRLDIVASQATDQGGATRVSEAEGHRAAWTVADGGVKVGGARAIALALAVGRQARWPVLPWKVPGASWLLDRAYALVAANRHRLPGERPWCLEHPAGCTPRSD
jgi:predicted DCC family thiol-disulfide oxidoreductase YuxK